jgi:predicted ATPase
MIRALQIKDGTRMPCAWWKEVEALRALDRIEFAPGLTIVWGPNGCGKSTLLRAMARMTHCEQGGVPTVTYDSVRALHGCEGAALLESDGKPVHFFDPAMRAGLVGGMAGFDGDFMGEVMRTVARDKMSSGQSSTAEFNRIVASAATTKEVAWRVDRHTPETKEATQGLLATDGFDGLPTLLLDEPERSVSIPRAAEVWHVLTQQRKFQVIVATHSISALGHPDAKYIDLVPGYLNECTIETMIVAGRLRDKMLAGVKARLDREEVG